MLPFEGLACAILPNFDRNDIRKALLVDGNLIFTGLVTSVKVEKAQNDQSCIQIQIDPTEVIFGNIPSQIAFGVCGPSKEFNLDSESYKLMAKNLGWETGAVSLMGLTTKNLTLDVFGFTYRKHRLLPYVCSLLSFRLDADDDDSRKYAHNILDEFRIWAKDYK